VSAPGDRYLEKKEKISRAKEEMAKFYVKAVAEDVAQLIALVDPQRRLEAMRIINSLIVHARGEAEFSMPSPTGKMLTTLRAEPAHSKNNENRAERQKQRREGFQPFVAEIVRERPEERHRPAKIATQLRRRPDFKDIPRRTLEEDVRAILKKLGSA
jgi:hypothetical protein